MQIQLLRFFSLVFCAAKLNLIQNSPYLVSNETEKLKKLRTKIMQCHRILITSTKFAGLNIVRVRRFRIRQMPIAINLPLSSRLSSGFNGLYFFKPSNKLCFETNKDRCVLPFFRVWEVESVILQSGLPKLLPQSNRSRFQG